MGGSAGGADFQWSNGVYELKIFCSKLTIKHQSLQ